MAALAGATLTAFAGEVHALIGENGAGKSTLARAIAGGERLDGGQIRLHGRTIRPGSPREASALGIGLVHQHFTLVDTLTGTENVALWADPGLGPLRLQRVRARAQEAAEAAGLSVPLDTPVGALSVGDRQRIEVVKLLYTSPDVLILDEPTAVLAPAEVEALLRTLRAIAAEGRTVVLIAHKLSEVLSVADRVTVLRGGTTVLEVPRAEVDAQRLAAAMIGEASGADALATQPSESARGTGRAPDPGTGDHEADPGTVVARLDAVATAGEEGRALEAVSLEVHRGEIVGVAGVEGNGQRPLAGVLSGRVAVTAGRATLPATVAVVPQDRTREGIASDMTLVENVALGYHDHPAFAGRFTVDWAALAERTSEIIRDYGVKTPGAHVSARTLSGGNQQKLIVGRAFGRDPDLVVAQNPTRGLDLGAAGFVHAQLRGLRARPRPPGIVLISSDLDELLEVADRITVLRSGRLLEVPEADWSRAGIGRLMVMDVREPTAGGDA